MVEAKQEETVPLSMTFLLQAQDDLPQGTWTMRWREALLGRLISVLDMPEQDTALKAAPYTISCFMPVESGGARRAKASVQSVKNIQMKTGERFRLRVSCLDDQSSAHLIDRFSSVSIYPIQVEEDGVSVLVEGTQISSRLADKWNNWLSCERLYSEASGSLKLITLKFSSVTAFKRRNVYTPLPDPVLIFTGYHDLWKTYSGIPLPAGLTAAVENDLALIDFRISTGSVILQQERVYGFLGSATFQLQGRHPESIIKGLNLLADYALFCGTGIGRKDGMGQTRRIFRLNN